jgi:hypothetical protein
MTEDELKRHFKELQSLWFRIGFIVGVFYAFVAGFIAYKTWGV